MATLMHGDGPGLQSAAGGNHAPTCSYGSFPHCHAPAVGEIRETRSHPSWPLCEAHIQPGMHPPDLRGKLVRWSP